MMEKETWKTIIHNTQNKKREPNLKESFPFGSLFFCDSGGIQTHNLLIRSQMLYSVELRNPIWLLFVKDIKQC